jgi:hypothetical protein
MTEVEVLGVGNVSEGWHGNYYRVKVDGVPHIIYWGAGNECLCKWDPECQFNELMAILSKLYEAGYLNCPRDRLIFDL